MYLRRLGEDGIADTQAAMERLTVPRQESTIKKEGIFFLLVTYFFSDPETELCCKQKNQQKIVFHQSSMFVTRNLRSFLVFCSPFDRKTGFSNLLVQTISNVVFYFL